MNIAHDESNGFFLAPLELSFPSEPVGFLRRDAIWEVLEIALKAVDTEISPTGREVGLGDLFNQRARHTSIISC